MRIEVLENGVFYRVWAPAKINLFFEILGKRPDGYHDVETLVAPISLFDRLDCYFSASESHGITLEIFNENGRSVSDIPTDGVNLVAKAYHAFYSETSEYFSNNIRSHLHVKLFKQIPTQAGLGGGSSDASAMLSLLNVYNGSYFSKNKLQEIGGRIGSDVPLFFEEGASVGRGRGELVDAFGLPELWATIVKPCGGLSTPEVYRQYSSSRRSPRRSLDNTLRSIETYNGGCFEEFLAGQLFNRLEEAAAGLWDGVERWKTRLSSIPQTLVAQMTGSGTAFFALYPNEAAALNARKEIYNLVEHDSSRLFEIEDVFVVKTLSSNVVEHLI